MTIIYITINAVIILTSIIALIKIFAGKLIIERTSDPSSIMLTVTKSGFYSVWISGKMFKAVALDTRNVKISNLNGNKRKPIKSLFNPQVNGFKNGRSLLKYYYLKRGNYAFEVENEQEDSLGMISRFLLRMNAFNTSTEYTYELRKTFPEFVFPFLLIGVLLPTLQLIKIIESINN